MGLSSHNVLSPVTPLLLFGYGHYACYSQPHRVKAHTKCGVAQCAHSTRPRAPVPDSGKFAANWISAIAMPF